jgi:hypothetical protein
MKLPFTHTLIMRQQIMQQQSWRFYLFRSLVLRFSSILMLFCDILLRLDKFDNRDLNVSMEQN